MHEEFLTTGGMYGGESSKTGNDSDINVDGNFALSKLFWRWFSVPGSGGSVADFRF
jgi:hypothetical protein